MNVVTLVGRITKDMEATFAASTGKAVVKFTLAVDRMKKGEADFIRCVAFDKTAETLANFTGKGSQIAIQGRIQTGSYDNKDGLKIFTTDVIVDRFDFCGGKNERAEGQPADKVNDGYIAVADSDSGEIPF